jgi:hypothetical protein
MLLLEIFISSTIFSSFSVRNRLLLLLCLLLWLLRRRR